jgi:hypothetical protein
MGPRLRVDATDDAPSVEATLRVGVPGRFERILPKIGEIASKIWADFEQKVRACNPGAPAEARTSPAPHLLSILLTPPEMSEVTSSNAPASPSPPGAAR